MENLQVIKVIETVVTVYTIKSNLKKEEAEQAVKGFHQNSESDVFNDSWVGVNKVSSLSEVKVKTEYQMNNDRPESKR